MTSFRSWAFVASLVAAAPLGCGGSSHPSQSADQPAASGTAVGQQQEGPGAPEDTKLNRAHEHFKTDLNESATTIREGVDRFGNEVKKGARHVTRELGVRGSGSSAAPGERAGDAGTTP